MRLLLAVQSVESVVQDLQRVYSIVLALAIGEAIKQFVADKSRDPEDHSKPLTPLKIHWERLPGLISFMVLSVPFFQGMTRHFAATYVPKNLPSPYSAYLLFDCLIFTLEGICFFVLSRALRPVDWRLFYKTVALLTLIDLIWGLVILRHSCSPIIVNWIALDLVAGLVFCTFIFWVPDSFRNNREIGMSLIGMSLSALRSIIDYTITWEFYFPSPQAPVAPISTSIPTKLSILTIYLAGPLFTQAEWRWNQELANELRGQSIEVLLPQESAWPMLDGTVEFNAAKLFSNNSEGIDRADVVVAILDGNDVDSGTAWECGYAFHCGKRILGVRTDLRSGGDDSNSKVNLMIAKGCSEILAVEKAERQDVSGLAAKIAVTLRTPPPP